MKLLLISLYFLKCHVMSLRIKNSKKDLRSDEFVIREFLEFFRRGVWVVASDLSENLEKFLFVNATFAHKLHIVLIHF